MESGHWDSEAVGSRSGIFTLRATFNNFFVTDGHPILASASSAGHIALWDLNAGGRLLHVIRGAHDGAVSAVEWVPGQPVLISSGEDNSVKVYSIPSTTYSALPGFRCSYNYTTTAMAI